MCRHIIEGIYCELDEEICVCFADGVSEDMCDKFEE